jgi:hypothetical protein
MAKVVRTSDNDYRIIVASGGTIVLDTTDATNDGSGTVIIRGDLQVKGNTTTVESTISTIADNIILLNAGWNGNGLPASLDRPYSSGIEIERGYISNARWVYDDSLSWALGSTTGIGTWVATQGDIGTEQRLPLATPGIVANGNFYVGVGNGVITVTGSSNYEEKVWRYESGAITPDPITGNIVIDDDNIPNAKAVRDFVNFQIATVAIDAIREDNSRVEVIDKNHIISSILEVGSSTLISTTGVHGYTTGDTITIQGVVTAPADSIINAINGTWIVTDTPNDRSIEFNRSTTGGNKALYIENSGRIVSTETRVAVTVEDVNGVNFYEDRVDLFGVEIKDTRITTTDSNQNLTLSAPGTGTVVINDTLEITKTPGDDEGLVDPIPPTEGIKIYSKSPGPGDTGVYFVNEETNTGELISKNRALLYGMIF